MKHYVIISGIVGGIIGSVLTALLVSPVTAQRDKFGELECTILKVVDAAGKVRVIFGTEAADGFFDDNIRVRVIGGEDGGLVYVYGKDKQSSASLSVEERGGAVDSDKFGEIECTSLKVVDAGGKASVLLTTDEHGGDVAVYGKDGISTVSLSISEFGGHVQVVGKGEGAAVMEINEFGNGAVSTWDKNGYRQ